MEEVPLVPSVETESKPPGVSGGGGKAEFTIKEKLIKINKYVFNPK